MTREQGLFPILAAFLDSNNHNCSTFRLTSSERVVCGRNMDFSVSGGVIMACPCGIVKSAISPSGEEAESSLVSWTSQYANLAFSLAVREFPSAGINECGLVVNEMTLKETIYPRPDRRAAIAPLQWIQYQLDNCATIGDVLATDRVLRVAGFQAIENRGHHFLVADASGDSVIIEFLNGERVVHQIPADSLAVLTNDTYQVSREYLTWHRGFGGQRSVELGPDSKNRFVCLSDVLRRYRLLEDVDPIVYAFEALAHVAQGEKTVWSIAFDVTNQQVYYRTASNPQVRWIDSQQLLENLQQVKVLRVENALAGKVNSHFVEHAVEMDREHATEFFQKFFNEQQFVELQPAAIEAISEYLSSVSSEKCQS